MWYHAQFTWEKLANTFCVYTNVCRACNILKIMACPREILLHIATYTIYLCFTRRHFQHYIRVYGYMYIYCSYIVLAFLSELLLYALTVCPYCFPICTSFCMERKLLIKFYIITLLYRFKMFANRDNGSPLRMQLVCYSL